MEAFSKKLIDTALKLGGTYYLPYRLHATTEQFQKAYPPALEFFQIRSAVSILEAYSRTNSTSSMETSN